MTESITFPGKLRSLEEEEESEEYEEYVEDKEVESEENNTPINEEEKSKMN
jgi:hypothetical protein